jgi:hypothetical protein
MPTVARIGPYRFFFFFANEGLEPLHIHVQRDRSLAKFWLHSVALASSSGFAAHEIRRIQDLVEQHRDQFERSWHDFFAAER